MYYVEAGLIPEPARDVRPLGLQGVDVRLPPRGVLLLRLGVRDDVSVREEDQAVHQVLLKRRAHHSERARVVARLVELQHGSQVVCELVHPLHVVVVLLVTDLPVD